MPEETLRVIFEGVDKGATRTANAVKKSVAGLNDTAKKTGPILARGMATGVKALQSLKLPIIVAGAGLALLGKSAISAGSDLEESMNKANEVFKESVGIVEDFAATSAKSFGIAKGEAFEYTGTLGTILNASGLASDATSDMSVNLTSLAADMASFNNIPIDVAIEKIRAGLVGSAEPLRTVGVLLDENTVKQTAYKMGLAEVGEELTQGEKVQARYALIMEQTATQQGDFARTSTGLANTQRILSARFKDLQATLGQALLPVTLKLMNVISDRVLPALENFLPKAIAKTKEVFAALRPTIEVLVESFKTGFETIRPIVERAFNFILNNKPALVAAIAAIGLAIVIAFGPVSIAIAAIIGLITAIGWIRNNWEMLRDKTKEILGKIATVMQNTFANAANAVIGIFEDMVNGIISTLNMLATPFNTMIDLFNKITGFDVGKLRLDELSLGRVGKIGGGVGGGLDSEGFIDFDKIVDELKPAAEAAGEEVGDAFAGGLGDELDTELPEALGGAAAAAIEEGESAWERGARLWMEAVARGVRDGTVTFQDAVDNLATIGSDGFQTIINELANKEKDVERIWQIITDTIERGFVRIQDIAELRMLALFGAAPDLAAEAADDFINAMAGADWAAISVAIFEHTKEEAAKAAQEAAEEFNLAFTDALTDIGGMLEGIVGALQGLAGEMSREQAEDMLDIYKKQLEILNLQDAALEGQAARAADIARIESDIAHERTMSERIIAGITRRIEEEEAALKTFITDANDRLVDAEERLADARKKGAAEAEEAEENLARVREESTEKIREAEQELNELRRQLEGSAEIAAGGPRTLTDVARELEQARRAGNIARARGFQAELGIAQAAAKARVGILEEEISTEQAAIDAAQARVDAIKDEEQAIRDEIAAIKEEIRLRREESDTRLDALRDEIGIIEDAAAIRIEALEKELKLIRDQRSAAEDAIAALEDEIDALEEVNKRRRLERDILVTTILLDENLLKVEGDLRDSIKMTISNYDALTSAMDILNDGVLDARDAVVLLQLGFEELARTILELISGLTPSTGTGAGFGGVGAGIGFGPRALGAPPGPGTTVVNNFYPQQMVFQADPKEIQEALGRVA